MISSERSHTWPTRQQRSHRLLHSGRSATLFAIRRGRVPDVAGSGAVDWAARTDSNGRGHGEAPAPGRVTARYRRLLAMSGRLARGTRTWLRFSAAVGLVVLLA